jgi:hypothetical protein
MITITLTLKELKLIQKSLLNKKMGKAEELIWYSIQEKIEKAKKDYEIYKIKHDYQQKMMSAQGHAITSSFLEIIEKIKNENNANTNN